MRVRWAHPANRVARSGAVIAMLVSAFATAAPAQEQSAARKFGRGLAGLTLGILELPGNMVEEGRANGALSAMTVGFVMGVAKVPARTLIGAYELLSAPFPLPAGFQPLMAPEFSWQYFESGASQSYGSGDAFLGPEALEISRIPGAVVARRRGALVVRFPSDLLFEPGSSSLSPAARSRLSMLAGALRDRPQAHLQVHGYADTTGDEAFNKTLSAARARAVRGYLAQRGIDGRRIETVGYGAAGAVASNATPEGRRLNRRVEIEIRSGSVAAR